MKKALNKKGFTLVELLAVIIVLGIVMLIATRAVVRQMNESKGAAAITQAKALQRDLNNYCTLNGTMAEGDGDVVTAIIDQDNIFSGKANYEGKGPGPGIFYGVQYVDIELVGTKFSTIVAPKPEANSSIQLLKPDKTQAANGDTVTNGFIRIYLQEC